MPKRLLGIATSGSNEEQHPIWRLSLLDLEFTGEWSWEVNDKVLFKIHEFLTQMEQLTWREIRDQEVHSKSKSGRKHKFVPRSHLTTQAQRRLEELQLDDFDELFRFRLGNMERLWGVLPPHEPRVFYPIWWDPAHKICP
ncbi:MULTISPECIES: hypothetical protein [Streptomyces]|uniref:Uncharacterized protein n=2 Tax=Streptomyces TaxID=1883 RepID=A0ABV9J848_9ACTN